MAQFYHLASIEELQRICPNFQLENVEGIQCMIQDDQVMQFSEGQEQKIIPAVDQTTLQVPHNVITSSQNATEGNQFVVHHQTPYVIQQIDPNVSQGESIQFTQQQQHTQGEIPGLETVGGNVSQEDTTATQCIVASESSNQFITEFQPIVQQPIQINQQIQGVDVRTNVLVLQNHDQELVLSSNQRPDSSGDQQDKQHIIVHRQTQLSQPKQQQMNTQIQPIVLQDDKSTLQAVQPILDTIPSSQNAGQQSVINPTEQPITQYYKHVTVIDGFSQQNVTVAEQPISSSMNLTGVQQVTQQVPTQQYKGKKIVQQANVQTIYQQQQQQQQPQLFIPQKLELPSSSPVVSRMTQCRKKVQELETAPTPVFIVQKLDSPVIRQPQAKIRLQTSGVNTDKTLENTIQIVPKEFEKGGNSIEQANQEQIPAKTQTVRLVETPEKNYGKGAQIQSTRLSLDKSQTVVTPLKVSVTDQASAKRLLEQVNRGKGVGGATVLGRISTGKIKTAEQQTDPVDKKTGTVQVVEKIVSSPSPQSKSTPTTSNVQIQTNITTLRGAGRGTRTVQSSPTLVQQSVARVKGVQVQTSPPHLSSVDGVDIVKTVKVPVKGRGTPGRTGWTLATTQRSAVGGSVTTPIRTVASNSESCQTNNENAAEETVVLVLLLNGDKRIIRIPSSQQNILLGQIVQQAGLTITTPTTVAIEQVLNVSNSDKIVGKIQTPNNQSTTSSTTETAGTILVTTQQPCLQSQSLQTCTTTIPRSQLQFIKPVTSIQDINSSQIFTTEKGSTHVQTPSREEPRFVTGYLAICPFCGIQSLDFNKCIRCKRRLPENVKSQSIYGRKVKTDKATAENDKVTDGTKPDGDKLLESPGSDGKEKTSMLQSSDRKKFRPCVKKKKISDEPTEILILSSDDEEEDSKQNKTDVKKQNSSLLKKEPVYVNTEMSPGEMSDIIKESSLNEELMKNVQPGSYTTLQCRTIRIGSYKVQPKERVLISNKGIKLVVGSLKNETVVIVIPFTDVIKVLVHFGKQIPVIFIYPETKIGVQIRSILGMENKLGPYYDPASLEEETHKRIILLLEKISEDNKIILHKIFGQDKLEELLEKEANELLIRASPFELQNIGLSKTTESVKRIMVYPPPPEKGGITLHNQDYACLAEDQFLNDVIIDFYLKYLMLKVLSPEDRNRTHVFSTFFYKRLTTKPKALRKNDPENDPKLSPAEKRHMRVKGWTKQVNLFDKDFIIVPINEHSHWFLAIICFPGLTGPVRFSDNTPVEPEEVPPKKCAPTLQIGSTTITHIIKTDGNTISLEMDCGSDRDEAEGDQDDLHPSTDDEENEQTEEDANSSTQAVQIPLLAPITTVQSGLKESKLKLIKRKVYKEPIKQPCILIFDSLAGASRVRVVATLRDYLKIEYKAKMGKDRDFSKDTIKGAVPRVPQQNNFTDCGLYVLQYVESFFQDPLHDFKLPLKYLQDWFSEEVVSCKRQKLAHLIRTLIEEQGMNVQEMGLPVLTFTNGTNAADNQCRMDEEYEEDEDDEGANEEDDLFKSQIHMSDFDHDDEEDVEGMGEDDDEDEEVDDEELEVGEISRRWLARSGSSSNELETSVEQSECPIIKGNPLVDYDESESEEEGYASISQSGTLHLNESAISTEPGDDGEYCELEQSLSQDVKTSISETEVPDFESQILCTTIEKAADGRRGPSTAADGETCCEVSVEEEEEEEEEKEKDGEDDGGSMVVVNSSARATNTTIPFLECQSPDAETDGSAETVKPTTHEVKDMLKKLVNEKTGTVNNRKEEEMNSIALKKQLEINKRFKAKDCDKLDEVKKTSSGPCLTDKSLVSSNNKRSYQALKSVRIPKKADRHLEVPGKRQKVDET